MTRRRSPRQPLACPVELVGDHGVLSGFACDVSLGGVFVMLAEPVLPPEGAPFRAAFMLAPDAMVEAAVVVRWRRQVGDASADVLPGVGLEFVNLSAKTRAHLVRWLGPLPDAPAPHVQVPPLPAGNG